MCAVKYSKKCGVVRLKKSNRVLHLQCGVFRDRIRHILFIFWSLFEFIESWAYYDIVFNSVVGLIASVYVQHCQRSLHRYHVETCVSLVMMWQYERNHRISKSDQCLIVNLPHNKQVDQPSGFYHHPADQSAKTSQCQSAKTSQIPYITVPKLPRSRIS